MCAHVRAHNACACTHNTATKCFHTGISYKGDADFILLVAPLQH